MKFYAAFKGVDLNEGSTNDTFEAVEKRAEAKLRGVDVEDLEWEDLGISFEQQ